MGSLDDFYKIRDSLKDLTADEAIKKLQDLKINPNLSKEILEAANNGKLLKGSADEVADKIKKVGESSSYVDDLGLAFKGLGTEVLSVLKMLATNPLTWAIAGGLVLAGIITVAFNHVSKAGERAREATEEAINNYEVISSEVDNSKKATLTCSFLLQSSIIIPTAFAVRGTTV